MARFPEDFKRVNENIISFDFNDVANGLGFINFYLAAQTDTSGVTYSLTDNTATISEPIETDGAGTFTFDSSEFNLPRTVKGTAFMNIGFRSQAAVTGTVSAILQKWDGTTATNITASHTRNIVVTETGISSFKMPCTETIIAQGEQLRVVVTTTESAAWVVFGHDPTNRDGGKLNPSSAEVITSSNINIPFKVDI